MGKIENTIISYMLAINKVNGNDFKKIKFYK
jgi:hypothetical protein